MKGRDGGQVDTIQVGTCLSVISVAWFNFACLLARTSRSLLESFSRRYIHVPKRGNSESKSQATKRHCSQSINPMIKGYIYSVACSGTCSVFLNNWLQSSLPRYCPSIYISRLSLNGVVVSSTCRYSSTIAQSQTRKLKNPQVHPKDNI